MGGARLIYYMAMIRTEFGLALNQVASERGIDPEVVLDSIKQAILAAYRKDHKDEEIEKIEVTIDPKNGEAKLKLDGKDITPPGFGRIAAQTAKQVILQRVREAEKSAIYTDYQQKVGKVVNGRILRFDGPNVLVDIGRAQGIMPPREQVPSERYEKNERKSFYIKQLREGRRGSEIIVSRADKRLVSGLFEREVPEVGGGSVKIKEIAREPGSRTKIAVYSDQQGVDPVGSCVGQKGIRVQAVINELGGDERIDVIQWSEDAKQFITQALSPAKDLKVEVFEEEKRALVLVPEEELSLAIGRDGQNVRLAAKLVGYNIDIRSLEEYEEKEEKKEKGELEKIGLSPRIIKALAKAKITTKKQLEKTKEEKLKEIKGLGPKSIKEINKALGK